jgi:hypothetical protein
MVTEKHIFVKHKFCVLRIKETLYTFKNIYLTANFIFLHLSRFGRHDLDEAILQLRLILHKRTGGDLRFWQLLRAHCGVLD